MWARRNPALPCPPHSQSANRCSSLAVLRHPANPVCRDPLRNVAPLCFAGNRPSPLFPILQPLPSPPPGLSPPPSPPPPDLVERRGGWLSRFPRCPSCSIRTGWRVRCHTARRLADPSGTAGTRQLWFWSPIPTTSLGGASTCCVVCSWWGSLPVGAVVFHLALCS